MSAIAPTAAVLVIRLRRLVARPKVDWLASLLELKYLLETQLIAFVFGHFHSDHGNWYHHVLVLLSFFLTRHPLLQRESCPNLHQK